MSDSWPSFLKRYKGRGYSRTELSKLYQEQKGVATKTKRVANPKQTCSKEVYTVTVISLYASVENKPEFEMYLFSSRAKAEAHYKSLVGETPTRERQAGRVASHIVSTGEVAWALIKDGEVY